MEKIVYIISGSPDIDWDFLGKYSKQISLNSEVYAVDKGVEVCDKFNIPISKIIGDLDSVSLDVLNKYDDSIVKKFPQDKDKSDTELALLYVIEQGFTTIKILNADGGRMDHTLFNALLLFHEKISDYIKIQIITAEGTIQPISPGIYHEISLPLNTLFSLIPFSVCKSVTLSGCKYPLDHVALTYNTLTLSNTSTEKEIIIYLEHGKLLLFIETR